MKKNNLKIRNETRDMGCIKKSTNHNFENNKFSERGFTLIEIIVSLAIFSVVAVIAIGALVRVTGANRQAQNIQSGINNMSFVLDSITREMRVGTNYNCVYTGTGDLSKTQNSATNYTSCGTELLSPSFDGDVRISFTSSNYDEVGKCNLIYAYIFHQDKLADGTYAVSIYKSEQPTNACINTDPNYYTPIPVTAGSVHLSDYHVGVFSSGTNNSPMPYNWVFIKLSGYVGDKQTERSNFDVQTSISQRISS